MAVTGRTNCLCHRIILTSSNDHTSTAVIVLIQLSLENAFDVRLPSKNMSGYRPWLYDDEAHQHAGLK